VGGQALQVSLHNSHAAALSASPREQNAESPNRPDFGRFYVSRAPRDTALVSAMSWWVATPSGWDESGPEVRIEFDLGLAMADTPFAATR